MTEPTRTEPEGFEPFEPPPSTARSAASTKSQPAGWERATLEKLAFAALNEQRAARQNNYADRDLAQYEATAKELTLSPCT